MKMKKERIPEIVSVLMVLLCAALILGYFFQVIF